MLRIAASPSLGTHLIPTVLKRLERSFPALPMTEVALRAGFGGSAGLATAFRRATGLPPRAWRRGLLG